MGSRATRPSERTKEAQCCCIPFLCKSFTARTSWAIDRAGGAAKAAGRAVGLEVELGTLVEKRGEQTRREGEFAIELGTLVDETLVEDSTFEAIASCCTPAD